MGPQTLFMHYCINMSHKNPFIIVVIFILNSEALGQTDPKVTQQESKGHLGLSGSIHASPQCSKPISMEQGRRAQSGLRTSPSSAGSGTEGGGRGGQSSLLCPFPFFPLPAHPPTTAPQALCSKESVCFLAELTDGQASVLRPVT